jgi:UDP-N-acetylmuramate dehydrogenase
MIEDRCSQSNREHSSWCVIGCMNKSIVDKIRENLGCAVYPAEPLNKHTTYRVGGEAEMLVQPEDSRGAAWLYRFAKRERVPLTILGAGSNVIAPDGGIDGVVLKTVCSSTQIHIVGDGIVRSDAGVSLLALATWAARKGLSGFEQIAWIPGTVGGAVSMNAGTNEREISELLKKVEVLTPSGRRVFRREELVFGYRRSIFRCVDWLILSADFRLSPDEPDRILATIERLGEERRRKFPLDMPSAGSVFKRPPGDFAGRLIEEAGCKGLRVGDAAVSERHANFIVNLGEARSADIIDLIRLIRKRVFERTGVYLELEQIAL